LCFGVTLRLWLVCSYACYGLVGVWGCGVAVGRGGLVGAVVRGLVEIASVYGIEEAVRVYMVLHPFVDERVVRDAARLLRGLGWEE